MTDDGGSDFALQAGTLNLRDIELDLPDGTTCADVEGAFGGGATCEDSDDPNDDSPNAKIVIDGPFEVDLVAGTATPSLDDVQIPVGLYARVDFRVEDNPDDVSFAGLAGFQYQGDDMTLDFSFDFNEDIRIEDPAGISVDEDSDLIAEFVVDNWLAGIDVGSCIDDGDVTVSGSTVQVDESSTSGDCSDIEDTIKDNMKNSGQLDR
jgi:hypothetical protein